MSAPVNVTPFAKTDFIANAREGWGEALPEWVIVLAERCADTSATDVAKRLGYSLAVVTSAVRGNYKGDLGKVEQKVRGAYMGALVQCPVLDEIGRDRCVHEQGKKHVGTSALRAKLFRACRACEHSRLKQREAIDG